MSQTTIPATPVAAPPLGEPSRLFSAPFLILNLSAFFSAVSFSTLLPMISLLVTEQTGGGDVAVGFAISVFAVTAIAARPAIGMLGDQRGRRFLVVTGCLLTALTTYGHIWADTYVVILLMRLLIGAFQGAFFVGSAAMVSDLAPEHRRGEALSWFSVSIYGGMAIGPGVGEAVRDWADASTSFNGFDAAFLVAGTLMLAATAVGVLLPRERSLLPPPAMGVVQTRPAAPAGDSDAAAVSAVAAESDGHDAAAHDTALRPAETTGADGTETAPPTASDAGGSTSVAGRFFYRSAVWPGTILATGIIIFPALQGFLPKLAAEENLGEYGPVLGVYGILVLVLRVVGRKLPDRLGTARTATLALAGAAGGMVIMGTFLTPVGLYTGVVVLALGGSLLYPALMLAAVDGVPPYERARAVSTFTMFFELSAGIGGPVLGITAWLVGATAGAFYAAAACSLTGIALLWIWQRGLVSSGR